MTQLSVTMSVRYPLPGQELWSYFPRPGSCGKPDVPAPGSASGARPAHPRRYVKRDGAYAVPLNVRLPCRAQPTWLPRGALALDHVVDGRGLRLAGVSP